jgi:cytochrome c2
MKDNRILVIGIALLIIGVIGISALSGMRLFTGGMMGGTMMMDRAGMKEMMKSMMGTQLPLGLDPRHLPDPRSNGAQLLARYCTQCHELPGPGLHTADEWPSVVDRMNRRMQVMGGMMHDIEAPDNDELRTLVAYLQRYAQKPMDKTKYTDLNTPVGKPFAAMCSQCHALPDPKQHTADEWPRVVGRMTQNMKAMGKPLPDRATLESVVEFLQIHAK